MLLLAAAAALYLALRCAAAAAYPIKYEETVSEQCAIRGIDDVLVYSVIKCESSFNPDAVSSVGARGLMQLTEESFEWIRWKLDEDGEYVYEDMFDPEVNIRYGVYLLSYLCERFENEKTALAAYHAGMNCVDGWLSNEEYSDDGKSLKKIPYRDTSDYVSRVSRTEAIYETLYRKR